MAGKRSSGPRLEVERIHINRGGYDSTGRSYRTSGRSYQEISR